MPQQVLVLSTFATLDDTLDVAKAYTTMKLFGKLSHPLANRPGLPLILLLPFRLAQACVSVERLPNFLAPYNLEGYALHSPSGCWDVVGAWRSTVYEKMSKKEGKAIP